MDHLRRNVIIIIIFLIAALLFSRYFDRAREGIVENGDDGEVCIQVVTDARNPLTGEKRSFPTPCDVPAGWEKIEPPQIIYDRASTDLIVVDLPTPGAVVGKEFSVIGKARGNWFFEASFPLRVLDKDGKVLAEHYATAQGEWMTTEFVPFKGDLVVPASYIGPATLILMKDNPSGLPEHDASISFPIIIEY